MGIELGKLWIARVLHREKKRVLLRRGFLSGSFYFWGIFADNPVIVHGREREFPAVFFYPSTARGFATSGWPVCASLSTRHERG